MISNRIMSKDSGKYLRVVIPNTVWGITTNFQFFAAAESKGVSINNNGLIVKARKVSGEDVLVAVNAPMLSEEGVRELRELEKTEHAKLVYVLATDWHHLHVKSWAEAFNVVVCFPSKRGWRQHEKEDFKKLIMDQEHPRLPDLDESTIQLIPWLGFNGVSVNHPDEKRRGEYTVYLPKLKLLYIFDILLPPMPTAKDLAAAHRPPLKKPRSNFGSQLSGFHVDDPKLCSDSAKTLLILDVDMLIFSHGDFDYGAILKGRDSVSFAMEGLRVLLIAPSL